MRVEVERLRTHRQDTVVKAPLWLGCVIDAGDSRQEIAQITVHAARLPRAGKVVPLAILLHEGTLSIGPIRLRGPPGLIACIRSVLPRPIGLVAAAPRGGALVA